ncbi:hypothetical protein NLM16_27125 [Bradyrhizobium brasilense]|uniref:hypothetical protein n=1 Tax=Bradyrhizobium brasilense TaxID=1419277 RepID=UPI002877D60F|nr:hypothetical protein [Bradyrhizobium brasilense]MCP3417786.1 hypothetical protein [Bradyrhizobium brasilense]
MQTIDLNKLLSRLDAVPAIQLANVRSREALEQSARGALLARGVVLKGQHSTIVNEVVQNEIDRATRQLQALDDLIELTLASPVNGRPSGKGALRDLLLYTQYLGCSVRATSPSSARRQCAEFFRLTRSTRTFHSRRSAPEQVRRAGDRTLGRFAMIRRWDSDDTLFFAALRLSAEVLIGYSAEIRGERFDRAAFESSTSKLKLLSRFLDAQLQAHRGPHYPVDSLGRLVELGSALARKPA